MNSPLTIVGIGCGGRTLTRCRFASSHPHRFRIVGGADPNAFRRGEFGKISGVGLPRAPLLVSLQKD